MSRLDVEVLSRSFRIERSPGLLFLDQLSNCPNQLFTSRFNVDDYVWFLLLKRCFCGGWFWRSRLLLSDFCYVNSFFGGWFINDIRRRLSAQGQHLFAN